ncbi:hypothetical protein EVG20_g9031, partial [Dentipellis fragilis]
MDTLASLIQRARTLGHIFFHHFGIHCATHQIRVLLICAVVITSLFYPALAMYSTSQPRFLAHFSSQILDPFVAADAISNYYAQHDLWNLWTGQDHLQVREDSVARARCGKEQTLRIERVLIHNSGSEDGPALSPQLLVSALQLEQRILDGLPAHRLSCLRKPDGRCLVISPLEFWHHSEAAIRSDRDIMDTLSLSKNVSVAGIPITPQMVLAGREVNEYANKKVDLSMFLVLTFFFPEVDCLGNSGHRVWRGVLEQATKGAADLMTEAQEPTLIALEFKTNVSSSLPEWSILTVFLYLAYFGIIVLFSRVMRISLLVHNGVGLIFTGIVEMLVSTITSLSVCALVGFKVTMIPWEIFPLVILFIGMENMFSLVEAVVKTSIALPVKERIAEGLSRAGTSNSLKVLTYNIILGIIAKLSDGAIRQFCAFAVVVLVAHWFLVHTLFVAVLSIDLQRMELDELLQQNSNITPSVGTPKPGPNHPTNAQPKSKWSKFSSNVQAMLKGRATKNFSLVLLLATTATLYFLTYPASRVEDDPGARLFRNNAGLRAKSGVSDPAQREPAWHIWHLLNPAEDPLLHLRIESPTILMFRSPDAPQSAERQSFNPLAPRARSQPWLIRTSVWLLRIFVLPIAITVALLYGLLRYLLKDAERLEAQRNRAEPEISPKEDDVAIEDTMSFSTLPRALSTDVELIAASLDGRVVATVGLENEVVVWFKERQIYAYIDTTDLLLRTPSTSYAASAITALAVDDSGGFCAVGTGAGVIAVTHAALPRRADAWDTDAVRTGIPLQVPALVLAAYENGVVAKWSTASPQSPTVVGPSQRAPVVSSSLHRLQNTSRFLAAFSMDDGAVELLEISPSSDLPLAPECRVLAGNPADTVTKICGAIVESGGARHLVIAAATQAGVVSLWDGGTGECIAILDEAHGQINNLRISPVHLKTCTRCGELPEDSFTVSFSVGHVVLFYRAYMPSDVRRCHCANNQLQTSSIWNGTLGRRSRSTSLASSNGKPISRSRHSSISDSQATEADFPISGHGVLSRRASEKDFFARRGMDTLSVQLDGDEHGTIVGPLDTLSPTGSPASRWRGLIVIRSADTTIERGSWDVLDERIVGVRRRPRTALSAGGTGKVHLHRDSAQGLSAATLERWE